MRIAVYTIAKDEAAHVARWAASCVDADYRFILDTGSTDGTPDLARALGVGVVAVQEISPWRFDTARNAALGMLPTDIDMCIALDMDEVLQPGWRAHLEAVPAGVTRPRYTYTWSWEGPGKPGLQYAGDKIHTRHGYIWKHPVHEVLYPLSGQVEGECGLEIHHHPDPSKPRSQYLPLLELAVSEDPDDPRNAHYYARELYFAGRPEKAEAEFKRHLSLPGATWKPERAQSYRYLYKITGDICYLFDAYEEAPDRREPMVDLAQHFHSEGDWDRCLTWATRALRVTERPLEYLTEAFAWGALPHDLAAVAAYKLGYFHEAEWHGTRALCLSPYDQRLNDNVKFYRKAVA